MNNIALAKHEKWWRGCSDWQCILRFLIKGWLSHLESKIENLSLEWKSLAKTLWPCSKMFRWTLSETYSQRFTYKLWWNTPSWTLYRSISCHDLSGPSVSYQAKVGYAQPGQTELLRVYTCSAGCWIKPVLSLLRVPTIYRERLLDHSPSIESIRIAYHFYHAEGETNRGQSH